MPRPTPPCGTWNAVVRHKKRGDEIDGLCELAVKRHLETLSPHGRKIAEALARRDAGQPPRRAPKLERPPGAPKRGPLPRHGHAGAVKRHRDANQFLCDECKAYLDRRRLEQEERRRERFDQTSARLAERQRQKSEAAETRRREAAAKRDDRRASVEARKAHPVGHGEGVCVPVAALSGGKKLLAEVYAVLSREERYVIQQRVLAHRRQTGIEASMPNLTLVQSDGAQRAGNRHTA